MRTRNKPTQSGNNKRPKRGAEITDSQLDPPKTPNKTEKKKQGRNDTPNKAKKRQNEDDCSNEEKEKRKRSDVCILYCNKYLFILHN